MSSILAVDVGGSGLRAERVEAAGGPPQRFESAGAAINSGGIDLEALLADVEGFDSRHDHPPDVVVWSMRGLVGLTDPQQALGQVHSRLRAEVTVVASDAVTSLVGALGAVRPGAVLAAGSGAVAFATDFGDVWRMVDGWGHVLADRGSGAWIGLEGLRAALATEDRVRGGSALLHEAAVAAWGRPRLWPRAVMTTQDAQARLAAFAPVVASLAGRDDVAAQVVARAVEHLADSVESAAASVTGAAVAAVGGLFLIPEITAAFEVEASRRGLALTAPAGTALDGAVVLGRHVSHDRALVVRSPYLLRTGRGSRPRSGSGLPSAAGLTS